MKKKANAGGRPTKYKPELCTWGEIAGRAGLTDEEIAKLLQVNVDTIYEWQKKYPEFSEAIKRGKEGPDDLVEASLLKRATGFKRTVERMDKDGCIHELSEELPPDPVSMIFWLKNRRKDRWRDKQEVELSGNVTVVIED